MVGVKIGNSNTESDLNISLYSFEDVFFWDLLGILCIYSKYEVKSM